MTKVQKKKISKHGEIPGSLIFVGVQKTENVKITLFSYDENHIEEKILNSIDECTAYKDAQNQKWINIDGVHNPEIVSKVGTLFNIHPLVLEDILDTDHRPKYEDYENYIYTVLKMPSIDNETKNIVIEQISILVGKDFVITFQEEDKVDVFGPIRNRLKLNIGKIRKLKSDYLYYSLLDAIVDSYLLIMDSYSDKVEELESRLINRSYTVKLNEIYNLKKEIMFLKKSVSPVKEIISEITRNNSDLISEQTNIYFKDIEDHVGRILEITDTIRETLSEMFDIFNANINRKTNEVMKTLTVLTSIFIPTTFIAGIYGMNFENMPELEWEYGYFYVLGIMTIISFSLIIYFKKKKWF